ncbi:MAG: YdcF family protein [Verrucomicrobiae bacterium]|nr:YdcF family protein [Verrucomicrobiae bacterium]
MDPAPPTIPPPASPPRTRPRRRWLPPATALAVTLAVCGFAFAHWVHPFLAPHQPVHARFLVVEGWVPDYVVEAAFEEFRQGRYERIFTTGGPLERGSRLLEHGSYPAVAAATLHHLGLPTNAIVAVEAPPADRNRTYTSALSFRDYCLDHGIELSSINLVSLGTHARRSGLCFQRALGPSIQVGLIAVPNREYDPNRWWAFSEGLKSVAGELVALAYAAARLDYGR